MRVKFYGARGSIPTPLSEKDLYEKVKYALEGALNVNLRDSSDVDKYLATLPPFILNTGGGNTSCVEVRAGDNVFILDFGSGARQLGIDLMREERFRKGQATAYALISHTHWDHVQGFPFFTPVFIRGNKFNFYSPFTDLRDRFEGQQADQYFPVSLDYMQAERTWNMIQPGDTLTLGGATVRCIELNHPGRAFAYRIDHDGKSVVYATDGEYPRMDENSVRPYIEFYRGADLLIFDAQFSFQQAVEDRRDWGHSSPNQGASIAYRAGIKRLALTHHDPLTSDEKLWTMLTDARADMTWHTQRAHGDINQMPEVLLAREGLVIEF